MVAKSDTELDAVIVGAGFAGIHMLSSLISFGYSAIVLEAGDEVGGTWNWNRYPGARSVSYTHLTLPTKRIV